MQTVSLFDAKTHLSRLVNDLVCGREDRVVIARRGHPSAIMTPIKEADVSKRIGVASGRFDVPDDIDRVNPAIASMFSKRCMNLCAC